MSGGLEITPATRHTPESEPGEPTILPATYLQSPYSFAADYEISTDAPDSGSLAPSIAGIPAHESEEQAEAPNGLAISLGQPIHVTPRF